MHIACKLKTNNQEKNDIQEISSCGSKGLHYSVCQIKKIKSLLYSRSCAEVRVPGEYEYRAPSSRLSAWATQFQRKVAAVTSRWRNCVQLDRSENRTPDLSQQ